MSAKYFQRAELLLATLLMGLTLGLASYEYKLFDFALYWNATRHFIAGLNPYQPFDLPVPATSLIEQSRHLQVMSPPSTFIFFWPSALLEWGNAGVGFVLLLGLSGVGCLLLLWRAYGGSLHRSWAALLLLALCFPAAALLQTVAWGAVGWVSLIGVTLFILAYQRENFFWAGVGLSFTLLKPHLFWLLYLYLIVVSLQRRNYRLLLGWGSAVVLLLLLPLLVHADVYRHWLSYLALTELPTLVLNASIPSIVGHAAFAGNFSHKAATMAAAAVLMLLLLGQKALRNPVNAAAILLPLSLLFAPYAWGHDYIVCLPLLLLAAALVLSLKDRLLFSCLLSYQILSLILAFNWKALAYYEFILPQLILLVMSYRVFVILNRSREAQA